ncbi:MAG: Anti-sigma-K factor rskA, partial [Nocardioides sp.]|nr:Anti-sigma-K factor rskA [Nocardioides sp.]
MNMSDIHALSGAYAVDALDDLERARFERHLAECDACTAEVGSLRETSALLAETSAAAPPVQLRDRVLADIATVRPLPPVEAEQPTGGRSGRRRLASLMSAAAVIAAIGVGSVVWHPWDPDTSQSPPSATDLVLAAPDAESFSRTLNDGSTATVVRSRSLKQAVVVTKGMKPPAPGTTYELWLQHGQEMVPAGFMVNPDRPVLMTGDAASAVGAGITIEPEGG